MMRIGLVGDGLMARVYARQCSAIPDAEVTAVVTTGGSNDIEQHVSDEMVYDTPQEMCKDALDAVFVCSPPDSHRSLVKAAADQGLAVFCDLPIASTIEDARAIADIAQHTDIIFVPSHVCRVSPEYVTAKERVDDGEIGSVGNVRAFRQLSVTDRIASCDRETDVVFGLALHDIDFLRWVCGEVERVFAQRAIHDRDVYALFTLRFANGAVGHIDARLSEQSDQPFVRRFELAGDKGLIEYDSEESTPVMATRTDDGSCSDGDPFDTMLPKDPHQLLLEHVLDCVEGNTQPLALQESIESLRVGIAALASMESGVPVSIEEVSD